MILAPLFFFCLGAIVASFVGVVVERLNTGSSWISGRSRCDSCTAYLRARDLVPLLSWLTALGRCRSCSSRVSWYSTASEAVLGTLYVVSYALLGVTPALAAFLLALTLLLAIVLYDLRHMLVPLEFSVPFVLVSALCAALAARSLFDFGNTVLIAGIIAVGFFLIWFLSKGRAMGLGDAPVAFGLSLLVGSNAFSGLVFSFWIGAAIGIFLLVVQPSRRRMGVEVPFVPFMAAGFLLAYFTTWSPTLIVGSLLARFIGN
jgi:prepilin signal peptidase PulO-like enzyme (type II secretory pathway)